LIHSLAQYEATAWGKAILFGEHSVVYGGIAGAIPLKDIPLKVSLSVSDKAVQNQIQWNLKVCNEPWIMTPDQHTRLDAALRLAFQLTQQTMPSNVLVEIDSSIPLGGGLGGSAALSSAFLRIATQIKMQVSQQHLSEESFLAMANALDSHFHGKASGLDVAAVNSEGPIGFKSNTAPWLLPVSFPFQIALVDTGVRTETFQMVSAVRSRLEQNDSQTHTALSSLKVLGSLFIDVLKNGNLMSLAELVNTSQKELNLLGVSHTANDLLCKELLSLGCLGAKLTGGGGGGMVLGVLPPNSDFPCVVRGQKVLKSQVRMKLA
jgi:mevalonate kinase